MRTLVVSAIALAALAALFLAQQGSPPARADSDSGESLSTHMGNMQRHTHKLGLSIDAQNYDLASFYMQEIREASKHISGKFPQYDGHQVGALLPAMLNPHLDKLSKSIEAKDWKAADPAYDTLIVSGCNGCHTATRHAFVKIVRVKSNPYSQEF
jgi:hypothetical protein